MQKNILVYRVKAKDDIYAIADLDSEDVDLAYIKHKEYFMIDTGEDVLFALSDIDIIDEQKSNIRDDFMVLEIEKLSLIQISLLDKATILNAYHKLKRGEI